MKKLILLAIFFIGCSSPSGNGNAEDWSYSLISKIINESPRIYAKKIKFVDVISPSELEVTTYAGAGGLSGGGLVITLKYSPASGWSVTEILSYDS